ncbi:cytochrome c-type biogenesis protein [Alteromonas oceanisediminis]|uniref:cytochrome c-type biogenesis protein n=1 Tax=Alteromonas oceanisediminis TaxID=2836180 RepID=UPI002023BB56|nr:cytochrome c-type biogenesis protein [Alteromonas oceanisediminis]
MALAQVQPTENSPTKESLDSYQFSSEAQRQTFLSLTAELRCPMCQNQNIADSDAMIAHDMRRKVYQLLQQGRSEQDVINFMKQRYGDFVHYQPPVTAYTMWLWLLPVVFAVVALLAITRKRNTQSTTDIDEKLAEADKLLARED